MIFPGSRNNLNSGYEGSLQSKYLDYMLKHLKEVNNAWLAPDKSLHLSLVPQQDRTKNIIGDMYLFSSRILLLIDLSTPEDQDGL